MRKIVLISVITLFGNCAIFAQQNLSYTQYIENQTAINPTYSLLNTYGSVNTLVRKQWVGIPGAPTTYMVNADAHLLSINSTVGFTAENDLLAIEKLAEFNVFFAKGIRLSDNQNLAVSLSAGIRYYKANYAGIDASDPVFSNNIAETRPNVGFGVMYYTAKYYLGLSVPEFNIRSLGSASAQDNTNFRNHYYFTAGTNSKIGSDYTLKYAAVVAYSKDIPLAADISSMLYVKNIFGVGANYRSNNELAGMFSLNYNIVHVGYSYQFGVTTANVGGFKNATQEVTLGIRFGPGSPIGQLKK